MDETSLNNSHVSRFMTILTMESLDISPSSVFSLYISCILTYCLILLFNSMLLATIVVQRDLHKPMYIILFNLSLCDLMGATAFYPQLICSMLSQKREISYPGCALQGYLLHVYVGGSLSFLSVMAYDRYIAICKPLRYNNLMTRGILVKFICMVWSLNCALIGSSFVLTLTREICRTNIVDIHCDNPSLMKLICGDTSAMNYYGLFLVILLQSFSISVVSVTYLKILYTCLSTKQAKSISKAMQTCGTHLVVFLSFEFNTLFLMIAHRFESTSPNLRRAFGVSVIIFPPILNPLIYGLKTREIRQTMFKVIKRKVSSR